MEIEIGLDPAGHVAERRLHAREDEVEALDIGVRAARGAMSGDRRLEDATQLHRFGQAVLLTAHGEAEEPVERTGIERLHARHLALLDMDHAHRRELADGFARDRLADAEGGRDPASEGRASPGFSRPSWIA